MNLKSLLALSAASVAVTANAQAPASDNLIVLDLSKATTELAFNPENGAWTGTYDDDETEIESQVFSFVHNSMGEYDTFWGFTASNFANNSKQSNTILYQFGNMALGGIELNEDGSIKTNSYGAPVTSASMPYLVAYANSSFARHPADMTFIDGKSYEAVGAYFNLNTNAYYAIEEGDGFARAFTDGDSFTLTIHGVAPDETEKTIEVTLASYTNGNLTINRGWTYVDLSDLGIVNQIWFSLKSTDVGLYGENTPTYFCMDKLMVRPVEEGSIASTYLNNVAISYNRSNHEVTLSGDTFAVVFDQTGRQVMSSSDTDRFSIDHLGAGVYIIKSGNSVLKIAR